MIERTGAQVELAGARLVAGRGVDRFQLRGVIGLAHYAPGPAGGAGGVQHARAQLWLIDITIVVRCECCSVRLETRDSAAD